MRSTECHSSWIIIENRCELFHATSYVLILSVARGCDFTAFRARAYNAKAMMS